MRILICHGYLLKGTGSNQYVQSMARTFCRRGHHLLVMCQDKDPRLDFVSVFLREGPRKLGLEVVWEQKTAYPGSCIVFKPDIGGLLPVYVLDSYEGFEVKEFTDLEGPELERYVESNRRALKRVVEQFVPDVIHVNHTVMLPHVVRPVAREAGVPYFVTVHGSAIEFTVKKDPRYMDYAVVGLGGAEGIFVLSRHSDGLLREMFGDSVEGLTDKIIDMPPGVDTGLYRIAEKGLEESVEALLELVEGRMAGVTVGDFLRSGSRRGSDTAGGADISERVTAINAAHPDWVPEPDIARSLRGLASSGKPFMAYLGKLLETKGVQCILPALPLVLRDHPDFRLVIIGFGSLRGVLDLMLEALDAGDVRALGDICGFADARSTRVDSPFGPVTSFLDGLAGEGALGDYVRLCRDTSPSDSVIFTGYLTPEEHSYLLPHARAMLMPSIAPEAFGLVATEAMACGVTPVAARHSGLAAALGPVDEVWKDRAAELVLGTPDKLVFRIAAACRFMLDMPDDILKEKGALLRDAVIREFGWDSVCEKMASVFERARREPFGEAS